MTALSALELGRLVRRGELTSEGACRAFLDQAQRHADLRLFLDLDADTVLEEARTVDRRIAGGEELSPLAGVPVAVKDNLCVAGRPTTAGSRMLAGWIPPYDAAVIEKMRRAGLVPFGKTNCDEFAMGSSTEHSAFGPSRNPRDPSRVPGGSSGGSAAAVAASCAPLALGSDTGGSIRQPAAFCGVVGIKPTYGLVSRRGLVAFASSLDQVGPFGRDVDDAAALLAIIAGHDPGDATSSQRPVPDLGGTDDAGPFRFGVLAEAVGEGLDEVVRDGLARAAAALEARGGRRVEVELPHAPEAVATYYVVATAEASSNLARHDGVRYGHRAADPGSAGGLVRRSRSEGFGPEVQRRILMGTYVLSAGYHDEYYRRANRVRTLIARDFDAAFERCDVVLTPTAPTVAFRLGEKLGDPLAMYLSDAYTVPVNLAGLPAISLPCGADAAGLPVGAQLVAPRFGEPAMLRIARRLEEGLRADA